MNKAKIKEILNKVKQATGAGAYFWEYTVNGKPVKLKTTIDQIRIITQAYIEQNI